MYVIIDTATRNILGEEETKAAIENLFIEYVARSPDVAQRLKILTWEGDTIPAPSEKLKEALVQAVEA